MGKCQVTSSWSPGYDDKGKVRLTEEVNVVNGDGSRDYYDGRVISIDPGALATFLLNGGKGTFVKAAYEVVEVD